MVIGFNHPLPATPDPWSIGDIGILDNTQLANGPGISQRAAAARSQRLWRPGAQALKLDRLQATWYKIL